MLNEELNEDVQPDRWLNIKEALEEAREMVATVVTTVVFTPNRFETFVLEINGIQEMTALVKEMDKLVAKKKIKKYTINNLNVYKPINFEFFKKTLRSKV